MHVSLLQHFESYDLLIINPNEKLLISIRCVRAEEHLNQGRGVRLTLFLSSDFSSYLTTAQLLIWMYLCSLEQLQKFF